MKFAFTAIAAVSLVPIAGVVTLHPRQRSVPVSQDPVYEVRQVRPHVHVIRGAGPNVVVFDDPDGLVVVDSKFAHHAPALQEAIWKIRRSAITYLINTHHHSENCDGNRALPDTSTRIIAHDAADHRIRAAEGRGADLRFRSRLTIAVGKETITCHHKGSGHTDGDTIVHFAKANLLVTGGLIADQAHPVLRTEDGGDLRAWIRTLVELERDFGGNDLIVVPGDGEPGGVELIQRQLQYLRDVLDFMEDAQRHGMTRDEAQREAATLREKYSHYRGDHFEDLLDLAYDTAGR